VQILFLVALTGLRIDGILMMLPRDGIEGRESVFLRMGWRACILVGLTFLLSACDIIGASASIDDIILTTGLDADYCPIDEEEVTAFAADGPLYCSVIVSNLRTGSTVTSRWYFGEQFVEEINYEVETGGSGCVGFELTSPYPWPKGGYRVEVYLDGYLERAASFAVS
jgi:hypothetical protein